MHMPHDGQRWVCFVWNKTKKFARTSSSSIGRTNFSRSAPGLQCSIWVCCGSITAPMPQRWRYCRGRCNTSPPQPHHHQQWYYLVMAMRPLIAMFGHCAWLWPGLVCHIHLLTLKRTAQRLNSEVYIFKQDMPLRSTFMPFPPPQIIIASLVCGKLGLGGNKVHILGQHLQVPRHL